MIMCRALSYEENTLDKSRLNSIFSSDLHICSIDMG